MKLLPIGRSAERSASDDFCSVEVDGDVASDLLPSARVALLSLSARDGSLLCFRSVRFHLSVHFTLTVTRFSAGIHTLTSTR